MARMQYASAASNSSLAVEIPHYGDDWRWVITSSTIASLVLMLCMFALRNYGQGLVKKAFTAEFYFLSIAVVRSSTLSVIEIMTADAINVGFWHHNCCRKHRRGAKRHGPPSGKMLPDKNKRD